MKNKRGEEPVGTDEFNRPIWGYNSQGVPVCYSRRANRADLRCMSPVRHANGRCNKHGGAIIRGPQHHNYRSGEYSKVLPQNLAEKLLRVSEDKEYISLRTELNFNTVHLMELMSQFDQGADENTWSEVLKLGEKLEKILFSDSIGAVIRAMGGEEDNNPLTRMATVAEQLVLRIKKGVDKNKLFNEIGDVAERRRKLTETEIKRVAFQSNNMAVGEVIVFFRKLVRMVDEVFGEDQDKMDTFLRRMDEFAGDPKNSKMLAGNTGAASIVAPKAGITEDFYEKSEKRKYSLDADFTSLPVDREIPIDEIDEDAA